MSRPEAASDQTVEARAVGEALRIPQPGEPIGRFFVTDVLGQGAMGVVLRAFDPRLERTLAIKLVHPRREGVAARARARLVAEARSLAKLSHPNVVAVYEVDVHDGRDYVAMELVEGIDLQKWLRQQPRSWREVIAAFAAAADGLAAVHRAGLVHRDIKPANILIGDDGRVRVGDFGIATRSIDTGSQPSGEVSPMPLAGDVDSDDEVAVLTSLTEEGQVVGTPAYMAPEQHVGADLGPAADQFAFCVSLYEALYHERPFRGPLLRLAVAKQRLPREPKGHGVPRWLYRVIAKGLAADPAQRFASMDELARALRRDVGRRRRRIAFALATATGVAAGALAMSTRHPCEDAASKLVGTWDPDTRASVEQAFAASSRTFANRAFAQAATQLDGYTERWVEMHNDACEATAVRGEQSDAMLDRRMACLEHRRSDLAATVEVLASGDDDAVDHAYDLVGKLRSIAPCGDAEALANAVAPPEDPQVRAEVNAARTELARASAAKAAGRYDDAIERSGPPLQVARELGYDPLLAEALLVRADVIATHERFDEALAAATESVWLAIATGHDETAAAAATSLLWLSSEDMRDFPSAQRWSELAQALLRRTGDESVLAARLDNAIGANQYAIGRYDDASASYERGLARIAGDEDAIQLAHSLRINMANVWNITGRNQLARDAYERELVELGALLGEDHPQVVQLRRVLADMLGRFGEYEHAMSLLLDAAASIERIYGRDSAQYGVALMSIGLLRNRQTDLVGALSYYQQAISVLEHHHDKVTLAIAYNNAGEVQLLLGIYDAAIVSYEHSLAIMRDMYDGDHADMVFPLIGTAHIFEAQERWDPAMVAAREAERIALATTSASSHEVISAKDTVVTVLSAQRRYAEALVLAREGLDLAMRTEDVRPRTRPIARGRVATLLNHLGKGAEALALLELATSDLAATEDPDLHTELELERALALQLLGRIDEALAAARSAERIATGGGIPDAAERARVAIIELDAERRG